MSILSSNLRLTTPRTRPMGMTAESNSQLRSKILPTETSGARGGRTSISSSVVRRGKPNVLAKGLQILVALALEVSETFHEITSFCGGNGREFAFEFSLEPGFELGECLCEGA